MRAIFALILTSCLFAAFPAFCFELNIAKEVSPSAYLKWDVSRGPVKIRLSSDGPSYLPTTYIETALRNALSGWQNVSGQNLIFQYIGTDSSLSANNLDDVNSIVWVKNGWSYSPGALGVTRYSYYLDDPPHIVDSDILLNAQYFKWGTSLQSNHGAVDLQQVLTHELGHLIGFSHSSYIHGVMFPYLLQTVSHTLSRDEIAGIRFLYGPRSADLKALSPVRNAAYVEGMAKRSLPLPVFRWAGMTSSSFTLEFSGTKDFARKVTFNASQRKFYTLTASNENSLLSLSDAKMVYWRVRTDTRITPARLFRFRRL